MGEFEDAEMEVKIISRGTRKIRTNESCFHMATDSGLDIIERLHPGFGNKVLFAGVQ